jgi:bis(5'-nucleosyl)-tetraphosphatase (symmetrical)
MATYAIGDVHGCFQTLQRLLRRVAYDAGRDRLWFVGDLINRGPGSLAMLRWGAERGDGIVVVLGNHDLHLLARAAGVSEPKKPDNLDEVLEAPDRDDLLAWLRGRPLLHREGELILVHAGLFPEWTPAAAERLAREVEERLRGEKGAKLLATVDQKGAERWREGLGGQERARVALAGFARLRTLDAEGRLCPDFSGPPLLAPKGCRPWFEIPGRQTAAATVIFGHWAALGLQVGEGIACLDSGAAWGRQLTALRLDDWRIFQEPAQEPARED